MSRRSILLFACAAVIPLIACAASDGARPAAPPAASAPVASAAAATPEPSGSTALAPSGAGAASTSPSADPSSVSACDAIFAEVPAGADRLCDEHVLAADMEIHWRSYGLAEPRGAVNLRYRDRIRGCSLSVTTKPPLFDLSDARGRKLATYELAGGFPTCGVAPSASHKTVIVVSEKHDFRKAAPAPTPPPTPTRK
jgi:hypothetical protein